MTKRTFYLGGLTGIPFTGKVGFGAFAGHVPAGGNLVILFAPHIGVTEDGIFGKFDREGQHDHDNACGAAIAAYKWLCENEWEPQTDKKAPVVIPANTNVEDHQFAYIRESLKPYYEEIKAAEDPQV